MHLNSYCCVCKSIFLNGWLHPFVWWTICEDWCLILCIYALWDHSLVKVLMRIDTILRFCLSPVPFWSLFWYFHVIACYRLLRWCFSLLMHVWLRCQSLLKYICYSHVFFLQASMRKTWGHCKRLLSSG